jgi:site-specific DNA recombinase
MGRLTLNVLLSFAQFEREVTGERIRDKVAASKKKGMWMGGHVPKGYDWTDRQLVINLEEPNLFENLSWISQVGMRTEALRRPQTLGDPK